MGRRIGTRSRVCSLRRYSMQNRPIQHVNKLEASLSSRYNGLGQKFIQTLQSGSHLRWTGSGQNDPVALEQWR